MLTFGVIALGEKLKEEFPDIDIEFVDKKYILPLTFILIFFLGHKLAVPNYNLWVISNVVFYALIPMLVIKLFGWKLKDFGIMYREKAIKYFAIFFILALPFTIYGSRLADFRSYYPIFAYSNALDFAFNELLIGLTMFATEFFFRGFLLFALKDLVGKYAIFIQTIPYTIVHIGKPELELYYSFFAGIAFGYMDYDSKSIFPSFLLHYIGSVFFDILCII